MKALQRFISIFLFLATLSCNFDGSLDRQVCNGCTNGVQSLATIFFLNQEDGSDRYCVGGQMDWAMRTFDLTPWGGSATQMFANGSALASSISSLTGQQWSYVPATCSLESRTPGAVDAMGELSRPGCTPEPTMVYSYDATTEEFLFSSVTTVPPAADWAVSLTATADIVDIDGTVLHPTGTVLAAYGAGTLIPADAFVVGSPAPVPGGSYELSYVSDTCSYNEDAIFEVLKPFVSVETAAETNQCIQDSGLQQDGLLQLNFNGSSTTTSGFEQIAQVSKDGGATWLSQSSFSGAATWLPVPNMGNTSSIATTLVAGDMIRHCIREVGDTSDGLCDVKIIPQPVTVVDNTLGTISLTNTAVETNTCYSGDEYSVTLWAYASDGKLLETCDVPAYDPSVATADLSGCPAEISKVVSLGPDGNTLGYDPSLSTTVEFVHARNQISQVYDCDGSACDTNLMMSSDSFEYSIDESEAISFDTTFRMFANYITAAPGPDFRLHMFKPDGTNLVTYAAGSMYTQGVHFSADSTITHPGGTDPTINNYPLVGGTYHPALELPSGVHPLKPICIDTWDLCTKQANYSYTGWAIAAGTNYLAPASAAMTDMQSEFTSYTVPDQAVVTDCVGGSIYDSTMISISGDQTSSPTAGKDLSCGALDVNISSGGTATQITKYDLALGCCLGGSCTKELPYRDPLISRLQQNMPPASATYGAQAYIANPFIKQNAFGSATVADPNICYRENLDKLVSESCLWDTDSVTSYTNRFLEQCSGTAARISGITTNCLEFTLDSERTESVGGTNNAVVTIDFVDINAYNKAVAYFAAIDNEISPAWETGGQNDLVSIGYQHRQYKTSACVDDGTLMFGAQSVYYVRGLPVLDPTNLRITMDFNGQQARLPSGLCFDAARTDADLADSWLGSNVTRFYSTWHRLYTRENTRAPRFPIPATTVDATSFTKTFDIGINNSICPHNNPVQPYTIAVTDRDDWLNSWYFYRGDVATGTLLQAHDNSGLADAYVGNISESRDSIGCQELLRVQNGDGFVEQEMDWPSLSCDLSYYGGGLETFVDGKAFATRVGSLMGGVTVTHIAHYDMFTVSPATPNMTPVTCK